VFTLTVSRRPNNATCMHDKATYATSVVVKTFCQAAEDKTEIGDKTCFLIL